MRSVIITGSGVEHRHVANGLMRTLGHHLCGFVLEEGPSIQPVSLAAFSRLRRRYRLAQICERFFTKYVVLTLLRSRKRQSLALKRILGGSPLQVPSDVPFLRTTSANKADAVTWIGQLRPDLIFIYGTGVISNKVLSLASIHALNLHTGLSPFYRGSGTTFWPLYNGEGHMLGATVHECTSTIDGGDIYGRISVQLADDDDAYSCFAKCVQAGARLYSYLAYCFINDISMPEVPQDISVGKEYRYVDRTFLHELRLEYSARTGRLRRMIQESRIRPLPFATKIPEC